MNKIKLFFYHLTSIFVINIFIKFFNILFCYQKGKSVKNPIRYPFIPYPIVNYPFEPSDIADDLRERLEHAESIIDNILYISHHPNDDVNSSFVEIQQLVLEYVVANK